MLAVFNAKSTPYAVWTVADQTDSDVRVAVPVGAMLDARSGTRHPFRGLGRGAVVAEGSRAAVV